LAATEGAIAIVKGNLAPLNPNEQRNQQVYVYNYIFFSYALDVIESFKDLSTGESNPSWTQANHDMTGLKSLQILEIDGLSYLATTVINYRGHRIIA
jgi:protein TIF31